jgi:hypothetical protein
MSHTIQRLTSDFGNLRRDECSLPSKSYLMYCGKFDDVWMLNNQEMVRTRLTLCADLRKVLCAFGVVWNLLLTAT